MFQFDTTYTIRMTVLPRRTLELEAKVDFNLYKWCQLDFVFNKWNVKSSSVVPGFSHTGATTVITVGPFSLDLWIEMIVRGRDNMA